MKQIERCFEILREIRQIVSRVPFRVSNSVLESKILEKIFLFLLVVNQNVRVLCMKYRMHHHQHMNHQFHSPRIIDYTFSIKVRSARQEWNFIEYFKREEE